MTDFLHHAEAITRHRDYAMVDAAMLRSLVELLGRSNGLIVRLYRVDYFDGQLQITLTAWTDADTTSQRDIECDVKAAPKPMLGCLAANALRQGVFPAGGGLHCTWVPVSRDEEMLGCIEIGMSRPPTRRQITLIEGMRGLYANYQSLLRYSQIDSLTQLLNRKTFDENLHRLLDATLAPAKRAGHERRATTSQPANWLAVMDIDHFKRINDGFGHLFGDEVLILVANVMRRVFRRKDNLFRFGGEEFVVLLRDTTADNAERAYERFRDAIANFAFPQLGRITISIGYARVRPSDTPTTLLGRADEALYYAKQHGRNQVRWYEQLEAEGSIAHKTVVHTEAELF